MSQPDTNSQSTTQDSLYSPLDDPFFLSPADQPGLKLSETLFDGSNFRQWYNAWIRCDILVSRWIKNSMIKSLQDNFQYAQSSKHLWSELVERFGQLNVLELYELKKELVNIKQENASLLDYYGKIKGLWENIDHMDPVPQCSCGVMAKCTCNMLKRLVERETQSKLIQLLMGLHGGYEQVQSSLLSMEPLPPINRALGILQKIERQKSINDNNNSAVLESVAYVLRKDLCGKSNHKTEDCFQLQTCLFCEIKGHIIEHCYKFKAWKAKKAKKATNFAGTVNPETHKPAHTAAACPNQDAEYAPVYGPISQNGGLFYPTSFGYNQPGVSLPDNQKASTCADVSQASQVSPGLVQGIVDSVMSKVFQALSDKASSSQSCEPNSQTFSHFAGISPPCSIVNYGYSFYKDWVIDTGASDHITSDASILHDVINLPQPLFVALPDGTLKPVYRTGTVYLTKHIVLYDVLLIPDFKPNLLSVGKLISRSQLIVTFSNNTCLFQDSSSNTTIAIGKKTGDLYTLRISVISKPCNTSSLCSSDAAQQINVALFHSRLGHSSVEKLKHVNPVMLQGINSCPKQESASSLDILLLKKDTDSDLETQDVFINRDVVFYEHYFPSKTDNIQQFSANFLSDLDIIKDSPSTLSHNTTDSTNNISVSSPGSPDIRRSSRKRQTSLILSGYHCPPISSALHSAVIQQLDNFNSSYISSLYNAIKEVEPSYYTQDSKDSRWIAAMEQELLALEKNNTWVLTDLPKDKRAIGSKTLLAVAAIRKWPLFQLDVNNAFLHGYLDEEVYMKPPMGYTKAREGQVCRLLRSLYGLKQASRQWNQELTKFLIQLGYVQSKQDYSLFTQQDPLAHKLALVLVYVDDILLTGDDLGALQSLKVALHSKFTIKDLSEMRFFLGLEIGRN
ncbi:uncharacterized protein LOC141649150 [Silene latifolia]|uniref:uncharacterized protein LOC141649150 n=1 Tax=Silene latifolia TaxID=37657 RepID=UPI003D780058